MAASKNSPKFMLPQILLTPETNSGAVMRLFPSAGKGILLCRREFWSGVFSAPARARRRQDACCTGGRGVLRAHPAEAYPGAVPERGRKPTPLPPSHARGAHGRGNGVLLRLTQGGGSACVALRRACLGWYGAALLGRKTAALGKGEVRFEPVPGCARADRCG